MPSRDYADPEAQSAYEDELDERRRAALRRRYSSEDPPPSTPSGRASDFDEGSADIPIWGWLTGASARRDAARNDAARQRNEQAWESLMGGAPSVTDLTSRYVLEGTGDEYGDLLGGASAFATGIPEGAASQSAALRALEGIYQDGGYTDADAAMSRAMRDQQAQAMGSANAAALQQLQARGMAGGGSELAARLSGSQAMAGANSQADAALQMAAMQRALGAMQAAGGLAGAQRGQDMQRRAALDAFNQNNMDWRRGRESRNTAYVNRGEDSRAAAEQQAYSNRERATAGKTGQYTAGEAGRQFDARREDASNQAAAGAIGTIISEIL